MTVSAIHIEDMHCAACAGKVQQALAGVSGVAATWVNPVRRQVVVEHAAETPALELIRPLEAAGFHPVMTESAPVSDRQQDLLKRLGVAGLAMMQVMMAALALYLGGDSMTPAFHRLLTLTGLLFCIPVVTYSAVLFFRGALGALRSGINMDVPIALAIAVAFTTSLWRTLSGSGEVYFDSVVMFTFILLVARYVDDRLSRSFDASSRDLASLPSQVERLADGRRETVPLQAVAAGDRLRVAEGALIPVDGIVHSDAATVDESALTGESLPVRRREGETVFAGPLNLGTAIEITARTAADASRLSDIARLAERAQLEAPRLARLADRVARFFVPGILLLAGLTGLVWWRFDASQALPNLLAVLVVSCPCALSLAAPAAVTAAMTRLRRSGVVLTRSSVLERLPLLRRALVDKTGTLTVHEPRITDVTVLPGAPADFTEASRCLAAAAALEDHSSHPYAAAFRDVDSGPWRLTDVVSHPGAGMTARLEDGRELRLGEPRFAGGGDAGDEEADGLLLSVDGRPTARIAIDDRPRPEVPAALDAMRGAGLAITMVSGDASARCARLAEELAIDFAARQAPEAKLELVRAAQQRGEAVLVLGDGVNDAAALAAADVGVAMFEASDLVKQHADVILLNRRLGALADLLRVGRRCRDVQLQNLGWALAYNLCAIPAAATGLVPPWLAALGMASSSMLVMLNAGRLLRVPAVTERR